MMVESGVLAADGYLRFWPSYAVQEFYRERDFVL